MTRAGQPLGSFDGLVRGRDSATGAEVVHVYRLTTVGTFEEDQTDCGHFFLAAWDPAPQGWWKYIQRDAQEPVTCVGCLNVNPQLREPDAG